MNKISVFLVLGVLFLNSCTTVKINLFTDKTDPLREYTLAGSAKEKILLINIDGIISTSPSSFSIINDHPNMIEGIVAQLRRAESDRNIRAVLLKIDSPGGGTTASDILYREIVEFKARTGKTIVASMMDMGTSGAYLVALPADAIYAHPTTVTGSVGVVFMRPGFSGLMDKIGVDMEVVRSGRNKDMGSPFRHSTEEETRLFQQLIDALNSRFQEAVEKHRKISTEAKAEIATARVFLAEDAKQLGLIDEVGYLDDAFAKCRELAGLPANASIVTYRRLAYPDDNIYNTSISSRNGNGRISLINLDILKSMTPMKPGLYYLWLPAVAK